MIATWMLYAAVLGVALSVVTLVAEYGLRLYGRSTRWLWATSLVTVLVVPVLAWTLTPVPAAPAAFSPDFQVQPIAVGELIPVPVAAPTPAAVPLRQRLVALEARFDGALPWLWLAGSVLAGLALALSYLRLRGQRSRWAESEVDGVPVLVSETAGPAVVGLRRSRIVVPSWVLEEPEARRRMILAHEAEHIAAGDARLVTGALAALVLAPWNPAAWWQVRRLRLAAELDCDARVLRRGADLRGYAGLLLDVGMRFGDGAAVAAFA
jgi:bla regulator protein blaR1